MKWMTRINLVLLILLSVSTGLVKIARMPEEMELFANIGFADWMTIAFGVVQLIAGLALVADRTRRVAAAVLIATFVIATSALFMNGIVVFGVASLLFLAMAALAMRPLEPLRPAQASATAAA